MDDISDNCARLLYILCYGKRLGRLYNIQHMVRDERAFVGGWLGRADVHTAINLHGVHADDLTVEHLRERQGKCGLGAGSCAHNAQYARLVLCACVHG